MPTAHTTAEFLEQLNSAAQVMADEHMRHLMEGCWTPSEALALVKAMLLEWETVRPVHVCDVTPHR